MYRKYVMVTLTEENVAILLLKTTFALDAVIEQHISAVVSPERLERSQRFLRQEDRYRSLLGESLLKIALSKSFGLAPPACIFSKNQYGKPLLVNQPDIHFNIAHSGSWIACAVSTQPVGIDIERKKEIDRSIAERFFSPDEISFLRESPDTFQDRFFAIWALKESYIKALGMGLSCPLNSFCVVTDRSFTLSRYDATLPHKELSLLEVDKNYAAALCCQSRSGCLTEPEVIDDNQFAKLLHSVAEA